LGTLDTSPWLQHGDREKWTDWINTGLRQGLKTVWFNEITADHPWTTPKNMTGMGYTTT
jgi:hypothetical protein